MNTVDTLSNIAWFATIKLALARGFASGLVLAAFSATQGNSIAEVMGVPFMWAIFSLFMFGLVYLLAKILSGVLPLINLLPLLLSLMIIVGDPIVYVFNRMFPKILDLTDFKILNFNAIIIVYHPE